MYDIFTMTATRLCRQTMFVIKTVISDYVCHQDHVYLSKNDVIRIDTHAIIFSGPSVRVVDLGSEAFWSHFVRIGTMHFDQNLANSVRIGTRDPLGMSWVLAIRC